jgi:hypothetical protein
MDPEIIKGLITGITSGTVLAAILGVVLAYRTERIKKEVEVQFARLLDVARSQRGWKERAVADLLGPVCVQMDRTGRAMQRWEGKNKYLEAKVIREGNLAARDLLLKYPHLIPPDLRGDAMTLIEHYDRWLEEFEKLRESEHPDLETPFVFVGPEGFPFPKASEERFYASFREHWKDLYGPSASELSPRRHEPEA